MLLPSSFIDLSPLTVPAFADCQDVYQERYECRHAVGFCH